MKKEFTRFGVIEFDEKEIIHFAEGPYGFEELHDFIIVDPSDQTEIHWLQSIEKMNVAFPVLRSSVLNFYGPEVLSKKELEIISAKKEDDVLIYNIMTIPPSIVGMTINLRAPIIINHLTNDARQLILHITKKLNVNEPIYFALKNVVSSFSPKQNPDCPYKINDELLSSYISVIRHMQNSRRKNPELYLVLDSKRREIHDQIIKEAGVARGDCSFSFYLADLVEDLLS